MTMTFEPMQVLELAGRFVPSSVPAHIREEVIQQIALELLTGDILVDNLRAETKRILQQVLREDPAHSRNVSLDALLPGGGDGGSDLTLGDLLGEDAVSTTLYRPDPYPRDVQCAYENCRRVFKVWAPSQVGLCRPCRRRRWQQREDLNRAATALRKGHRHRPARSADQVAVDAAGRRLLKQAARSLDLISSSRKERAA